MDTSFAGLLVRLTLSLGLVMLLMVGSAKLLGRHAGRVTGTRRGAVQVLATQSLGRRASVTVVRVGTRGYVLGVTDGAVHVLGEADPDALTPTAEPAPATPAATLAGSAFLDALRDRTVRRSRT